MIKFNLFSVKILSLGKLKAPLVVTLRLFKQSFGSNLKFLLVCDQTKNEISFLWKQNFIKYLAFFITLITQFL